MPVLSVALQKGGVAKTTTTLAVGSELAKMGRRVLLVDMDPQSNLTQSAGFDLTKIHQSLYDVLLNPTRGIRSVIVQTQYHFDLAPATLALASAELLLSGRIGRELVLRTVLADVRDSYDYILLDTPPSLSLLTINSMCAADEVMIPLQCHILALNAIPQLQETINLVQQLNPGLRVGGIILTMTSRTSLSNAVEEEARRLYGDLVFEASVPLSTKVAESPAAGQPVGIYAPGSAPAIAYRELTRELDERYATTR